MTAAERERVEREIRLVAETMEDLLMRTIPTREERRERLYKALHRQRAAGLRMALRIMTPYVEVPSVLLSEIRTLAAALGGEKGE